VNDPADHLWFDLYHLVGGTPVPLVQNVRQVNKNDTKESLRPHWFGYNLPKTVTLSPGETYYLVWRSPNSVPGEGHLFLVDESTVNLENDVEVPTYGKTELHAVVSNTGGTGFTSLGDHMDTAFILGHLTSGDEARPMAVFDEVLPFPLKAQGEDSFLLKVTDRNIGEDGSLYARVYDHDTMELLGDHTLNYVERNQELKHDLPLTMPCKDLHVLVECGHFGPVGEYVPDDFTPLEIRFDRTQPLTANRYSVFEAEGGMIEFSLDAGAQHGNRNYVLLGGISGITPGLPLPGGMATLPLNWDFVTDLILSLANGPSLVNFKSTLDASGKSMATLVLPKPMPAGSSGLDLHFAFFLYSLPWGHPFDFASNPVSLEVME
jgi:hypothetical protein